MEMTSQTAEKSETCHRPCGVIIQKQGLCVTCIVQLLTGHQLAVVAVWQPLNNSDDRRRGMVA